MTDWKVQREGTWHFAKGEQPHWYEDCGDWCAGVGWKGWRAEGTVTDTDNDPNEDPARFGSATPPSGL